jgi:tetratricopeptide (TPR) repeat protein
MDTFASRTLVLGGMLLAVTAGRAQADDKADALEKATAAYEAQSAGDYDAADALYREAYCLDPDPATVFNLGTLERARKHDADAAAFFRRYLDEAPDGDYAGDAKALLKLLKKATGGDATIECAVAEPDPPDVTPPPVDAGPDGGDQVEPPRELPRDTPAPATGSGGGGLRWAGIATIGAGAALLGVGGYFGVVAKGHSDAISDKREGAWTDELLARQAAGEKAERNQLIFLVAGGAVAVTGIVLTVLGGTSSGGAREGATVTALTVTPLGADGGGVVLAGRY